MRMMLALAMAAALGAGVDFRPDYDELKRVDDDIPPRPERPRRVRNPGAFTPSKAKARTTQSESLKRMLRKARP